MPRRTYRWGTRQLCWIVLIVALVGLSACDNGNPVTPTLPTPVVTPMSIAITGRTSLTRPGDSAQLTATATFSDGTTRNVTAEAEWVMDHPDVVSVSPRGGLLTAGSWGQCYVTVQFASLSARQQVRVVPEGMFLVTGRVTDGAGSPVPQARVELTSSDGLLNRFTNSQGMYAHPARGDVVLRVEKDGYEVQVRPLTVTRDEQANFELRLAGAGLTGTYRLTFIASPSCTLPSEVGRRTYTAQMRETGPNAVLVELDGADFSVWGCAGFTGRREGNMVTFDITSDYTADCQFIEALGVRDRELAFSGTAIARLEDAIDATFSGEVVLRTWAGHATIARCQATDHRFEFTR
jgi:hypothetical protein